MSPCQVNLVELVCRNDFIHGMFDPLGFGTPHLWHFLAILILAILRVWGPRQCLVFLRQCLVFLRQCLVVPRWDHARTTHGFFFDSSTRLLTGCPLQSSEFSSTLINPVTQLPNRSYLSPMTQYIFWGAVRMSTELQVGTDHICLYIFSLALCSKQGHTSQHHAPGEGNHELGPIRHPSSTTVAWPVQKGSWRARIDMWCYMVISHTSMVFSCSFSSRLK